MKNRIYTNKEIKEMVLEDKLPEELIVFMSNTTNFVNEILCSKTDNQEIRNSIKFRVNNITIDDKNPYSDIEFTKRIYVDKLYLNLSDSESCKIHGKLQKTQVVCKLNKIKGLGLFLFTCNKCKKIFVSQNWLDKNEQKLINNNIDYKIWRDIDEKGEL